MDMPINMLIEMDATGDEKKLPSDGLPPLFLLLLSPRVHFFISTVLLDITVAVEGLQAPQLHRIQGSKSESLVKSMRFPDWSTLNTSTFAQEMWLFSSVAAMIGSVAQGKGLTGCCGK